MKLLFPNAFGLAPRLVLGVALLGVSFVVADDRRTMKIDVVDYVAGREADGKSSLFAVHDGYTYWFATAENRRAFLAKPAAFEIQLGGACARMGPLSGRGTTEIHAVHDGRVYIFASEACRAAFLKEPEALLWEPDPRPTPHEASALAGRELLDRAVAAVGADNRLDALNTYGEALEELVTQNGQEYMHRVETIYRFPGGYRSTDRWNDWSFTDCLLGPHGWSVDSEGEVDRSPVARIAALRRQALHHPWMLLRHRGDPDFVAFREGTETLSLEDGQPREVELVTTWIDGVARQLSIDVETGQITRVVYADHGPNLRLGKIEVRYRHFENLNGLFVPGFVETRFDGEIVKSRSGKILDRRIDQEADAGMFDRPADTPAAG
ncbi:MAG TPA: hypothetical protein VIY86_02840 [Pirellulaceae bacterium]